MPGTFYTFFKWVYFLQHPRELNIIISTSWMRGLFFCSQYSISLLEKLLERFCFSLKQIHLLNPMLHFTKFCTIIWHSVLVPSTGNCFFLLASMLAHSSTFLTLPSPLLSKRIPFSFCLIDSLISLLFSLPLTLFQPHWHWCFLNASCFSCLKASAFAFLPSSYALPSYTCMVN